MLKVSALILLSLLVLTSAVQAEELEQQARRLIHLLGCKGCHNIEGSGSTLAPDLDKIGQRLTLQQLRERLATHDGEPGPDFRPSYATTPPAEVNAITEFLSTLK